MEFEYQDESRRGRLIIILGVILALAAAGGAFYLVNQAQQQATTEVPRVDVLVAARAIPSRKPIEAADLAIRSLPSDAVPAGATADPNEFIGHVPAVSILEGQIVTTNLLASTDVGGQFSVLKPDETVGPDSPSWRAVAITVPDTLAVAGVVTPGMTVDIFLTATVTQPEAVPGSPTGVLITDRSTKVVFQDIEILARTADAYVIRVPVGVAEEIAHLQSSGAVQFSMALRPSQDTRIVDARNLGATTNLIITRYGLPIPKTLPQTGALYTGTETAFPIPTTPPAASPSPAP